MDGKIVGVVSKLKYFVKEALKSGKIKFKTLQNCLHATSTSRGQDGDPTTVLYWSQFESSDPSWDDFVIAEAKFRNSLTTRQHSDNVYYSHKNPIWWLRLIATLCSLFFNSDGEFRSTRPDNGKHYSIEFLKFVKRILMKFPITMPEETFISNPHANSQQEILDFIEPALILIKKTIRPCLQSASRSDDKTKHLTRTELLNLIQQNQSRGIDAIKNNTTVLQHRCNIDIDVIERHFTERSKRVIENFEINPPWDMQVFVDTPKWLPSVELFTVDEIVACLKKLPHKKSPGADGLTYECIQKNIPKIAPILTIIFNICIRFQRVPPEWKHSIITLVPKGNGDVNNIEDWRPISLLLTCYKIFMKLITSRHLPWIIDTHRLSPRQKGSMTRNGLQEHVFTLKTAVSDFLHSSGKAFLCFVDIKDAFGSIDHEFMIRELVKAGYPELFVNITKDIYSCSTFQIKNSHALTSTIERKKGIIQGCPWSVLVFEQGIDKWLRWIEQSYQSNYTPNPIQGYVDDVSLFCNNIQSLEDMTTKTTTFMSLSGMEVKPRKCALLHGQRSGNNWTKYKTPLSAEIQGQKIPVYDKEQIYRYLGHDINISNNADLKQSQQLLQDFKDSINKLSISPLPSSAKISLLNPMCFSPLIFYFSNVHFTEKQLKEIEDVVVNHVRSWLKLNNSSTRSYFFCPRSKGGLGIPNPFILYHAHHISFYISMLNCDDTLVRTATHQSLQIHMDKRKIHKVSADENNFLGYELNDTEHLVKHSKVNWPKSHWVRFNEMCVREGVSVSIQDDGNVYVFLKIDDDISLKYNAAKTFFTEFKLHKLNAFVDEFKCKESQGRIVREMTCVNYSLSCSFLTNDKLSDEIRSFAVRGRLQLLECDSLLHLYYPQSYTKYCKICNHPSDTVSHILNGCTKLKGLYQQRHNRVVDIILDKVKYANRSNADMVMHKEKILKPSLFNDDANNLSFSSQMKPDFTMVDKQSKRAYLVEISVPFDAHLDACYENKFHKYYPLSMEINKLGYRTSIIVLVFGSLGHVHSRCVSGLLLLSVKKFEAKVLCKFISNSTIIGSYRVWKTRCRLHATTDVDS